MNGRANNFMNGMFIPYALSWAAVLYSGLHILVFQWPSIKVVAIYLGVGFFLVGKIDIIYRTMNWGNRPNFTRFGYIYWASSAISYPIMIFFDHILGLTSNREILLLSLPMVGMMVAALAFVYLNLVEFSTCWMQDNIVSTIFGPNFSNAAISRGNEIRRARRRYHKEYISSEPIYEDFKPPLTWLLFCKVCGARNDNGTENEDCWYCHNYGRVYHEHQKNPNLIHYKPEVYSRTWEHYLDNEPPYNNGYPDINWKCRCTLCGARCQNSNDRCWYCEEKGRIFGFYNNLPCPFEFYEPFRYNLELPEENGTPFVEIKPRR